jgi:hypothetical protein
MVNILPQGEKPYGFHQFREVKSPRTIDGTGKTGGTGPDSFGTRNVVLQPQSRQLDNPARRNVHVGNCGTIPGTHTTLVTEVKVLPTELGDFLYKLAV